MRLLDTFAHQIETAHSVEARRAARFARDFAFPLSGVMSDHLAACDGAAAVRTIGDGLHVDAPMVPACSSAISLGVAHG